MRKATQRLIDFYETQLGQDVIETGLGAAASVGGQLMFTDMTPEQIALSTALGVGAAAVGRPVMGRAGQAIGTRLAKHKPGVEDVARLSLDPNRLPEGPMRKALEIKLAPYTHLPAAAQYGQLMGRAYGDNVMQGLVALAAPGLMPSEEGNE